MTIEKLPSGSYRIRQMYQGKMYSVTVPYKPTPKDALKLLSEKMQGTAPKHEKKKFSESAKEYVELKENVLSPRTVREYLFYINRLPLLVCSSIFPAVPLFYRGSLLPIFFYKLCGRPLLHLSFLIPRFLFLVA